MSQSVDEFEDLKESNAIVTKDNISNIVIRYNQDKECITNQIMDFYKNYKKVSKYLTLAVVRVRNAYNLPVKRKFIGEAMDDEIVAYNNSNTEIFLFKTAKQIKEAGFNYAMAKHSLINCHIH